MSYFKKFRQKFYNKIIQSNVKYSDEHLVDIERCFEEAAKETVTEKKNEGFQTQRNPKIRGTMTPQQIAKANDVKSRNEAIANWLLQEIKSGKSVDEIEQEYKSFGGGR